MNRLFAPFIFILFFVSSLPAVAKEISARQNEILMTAINVEGWLTEVMHKEFWAEVPDNIKSDPREIELLTVTVKQASMIIMEFQREAWGSIKMSLTARSIVRTPNYESAKNAVLNYGKSFNYTQKAQEAIINSEAMIEAAATGKPMESKRGTFYVTEELVERVLTGLNGSIHRFQRLTNPIWSSKIIEYKFSDLHVRILWDSPFLKSASEFTVESGQIYKMILLENWLSKKDLVSIGFVDMVGPWKDPEGIASQTASFSLKAVGISDVRPSIHRWRNRVTAEASGTAITSEGPMNVSIRIVEAREYGGFWEIVGISAGSLVEAIGRRETLEQSIQFD